MWRRFSAVPTIKPTVPFPERTTARAGVVAQAVRGFD
jgi:hypothetical protein